MPLFARLASLLLALLAALPTAAPISDADLAAKIDAIAAKVLTQPNAVGLSIAVGRDDSVIFSKGYGSADLEFDVPMNAQTMLRIGSVTKQFTAACIMKLVERNELSLDDTLATLLPDLPPALHAVTLRQLLTHTSGVWSYTEDKKFMERDASLELTPAELIASFKDHPLDFDPGTKWNYSNSGYYLLGEIIAKKAGKPYAEFIQDELFTPLGLSRTRYESNTEIIPNRAQGYSLDGAKRINDRPIGAKVPGGAGSIISNAEGLVRWNMALAAGKVVSDASYKLMTTPTILPDSSNTEYGFGLKINDWESHRRISHGGGIFGFTSALIYFPDDHITIAVISNSEALNAGRIADAIARPALGLVEFQPQDLQVSAEESSRFIGDYKFETIPMEMTFTESEGHLFAQATGQPKLRLLYQGNREFRAEFDPTVKLVFAESAGPAPADAVTLHQRGEFKAVRKPASPAAK